MKLNMNYQSFNVISDFIVFPFSGCRGGQLGEYTMPSSWKMKGVKNNIKGVSFFTFSHQENHDINDS